MLELYEDLVFRKQELESSLEDVDAKEFNQVLKSIEQIDKVLGLESGTGDPLIDKWEKEIAEGKTPNLDEGLPDGC